MQPGFCVRMADSISSTPVMEDQGRLLEDALVQVRQQTHLMRRCLETPGKLMDALKHRYASALDITFCNRIFSGLTCTALP